MKKSIPGAAVVRVLHSSDIDVTVPSEAARDKAQAIQPTPALKVFRNDYMVEVPGVPLTMRVAGEKSTDNALLAANIYEASKTLSSGLQITRIRWLHRERKGNQRGASTTQVKTRGSLLVGLQTQDMQRRAIQGGLVINAQLFEARPFERALLMKLR